MSVIYEASQKQQLFHRAETDEVFFGGAAGGGKVARLDAPILTPFGFKPLKTLKIGDLINNPDGSVQRIIQLRPVENLDKWIVEFTDGTKTEVAADHLWKAWKGRKGRKIKNIRTFGEDAAEIVETQEMLAWIKRGYTPQIPVCREQVFNQTTKQKKLDPYLLGVLLGDGCITTDSITISCDNKDKAHYKKIFGEDEVQYEIDQQISFLGKKRKDIVRKLKNYRLFGKKSLNKFIPTIYKHASIKDRYEIIRGLMDTDGFNDKKDNGCYYYTVSKRLAEDTAFILRSLGAVVTITKDKGSYKKNGKRIQCNDCYNLYIKHPEKDLLFSMERKKCGKKRISVSKAVSRIYIDGKITGKCITVSNPNGLYITDDFIVTHNSFAILWDAVYFCINNKNVTASIFRRTYPELEKSVILEALRVVPAAWYRYNKKEHRMYFTATGSILEFNYCLYDNDVYQFQSAQYDRLYFDELTHFNKFQYLYLLSRLRSTKGIKTQVKSASNPGNVGHAWVKNRFISDQVPMQETIRTDPETGSSFTTIYIPSKLQENIYLMRDDMYLKQLMKLPIEERKALLEGDWDILKGQFFEEWRYDLHVIKPIQIPEWWTHIRCMDWGYTKPAVVLWIAFDPNGEAWVYRELMVTKTSDTDLAAKIISLTGKQKINYTVADPSIWSITQYERGESVAYRLVHAGIDNLIKGDNNRIAGWNVIHSYLQHNEAEGIKPKIHIFETCTYLIETLPGVIHDDHNPEDINTKGDDHAVDALRYGLMTKPIIPKKPNITAPQGSIEYWLNKFRQEKGEKGYVGTL